MNKVLGRRTYVELLVDGLWYLIFCAKTASLDLNQDEIEVTSVDSGSDREFEPGMSDATITCSGITVLDNSEGQISVFYLLTDVIRRNMQTVRMRFIDKDGDTNQILCTCMIKTLGITKDVVSYSQSSVTFRVSGGFTQGSVPPPSEPVCDIQPTLYKTLPEGATSVSDALLAQAGVVLLTVARETSVYSETTGTPTGTQWKGTLGTGTIGFDTTMPGNPGGEAIVIVYKIEI